MAKAFKIPEDGSVSWTWGGVWYTMTYADCCKLVGLSDDPRGPTHEEKLGLIAKHGWETCPGHGHNDQCAEPTMTKTLSLRTMWLAHCLRARLTGVEPLSPKLFKRIAWRVARCS